MNGPERDPAVPLLEPPGTLDRRELIRRGLIAGGAAWAAPQVIRSTMGHATTVIGTVRPCTTYYAVRITRECCSPLFPEGTPWPPKWDGTIIPKIIEWANNYPHVQLRFPEVCPQLTSAPATGPWSVLLPKIPGPATPAMQCRMVEGHSVAWECKPAGWPHCDGTSVPTAQHPDGDAVPDPEPTTTTTAAPATTTTVPPSTTTTTVPTDGDGADGGGPDTSAWVPAGGRMARPGHPYQPCPAGWGCEGYVDPNPPRRSERGRRLIFPQCRALPIDEIQLIYCCP